MQRYVLTLQSTSFRDSGTNMTQAWPIFQGSDIGAIDWKREEGPHRLWCAPTVSLHHLAPSVVEDLWRWEMDWLAQIDVRTSSGIIRTH